MNLTETQRIIYNMCAFKYSMLNVYSLHINTIISNINISSRLFFYLQYISDLLCYEAARPLSWSGIRSTLQLLLLAFILEC